MWSYIRAGAIGGVWGLGIGFLVGASVTALIHTLIGVLVDGSAINAIPMQADSPPMAFQFEFSWFTVALASLFWGGLFGCINLLSGIIVGCLRLRRRKRER